MIKDPEPTDEELVEELYKPLVFDPTDSEQVQMVREHFPDMHTLESFDNPVTSVMFRAGMLVMRELVRLHALDKIPASAYDAGENAGLYDIWLTPRLGNDPGKPRLFDFNELVTDFGTPEQKHHKPDASREAAVQAFLFLESIGVMKR